MKWTYEDYGAVVGILLLFLMIMWKGIEETLSLLMTFAISVTLFLWIREKVKKEVYDKD